MKLLDFIGEHPVVTVIVIIVLFDGLSQVIRALSLW